MESDARIFVTGASGFIGTSLVRQVLAAGYKVRGMSRKVPVFPPVIKGRKKNFGITRTLNISKGISLTSIRSAAELKDVITSSI